MNIDLEKILMALGSAGSQTTAASLALLLFFYLRRQEKEVRDEHARTIRRLQAERTALLKEIGELQAELEERENDLDRERAARRKAENEAHEVGLRVVEGGKNVG
jgi:predicted nuclease with TOPRIM domain